MTDEALKILDLWANRDPTDARIDLYRGQVYAVKGQVDMALSCFRRSLERSSENPQAYFEVGKILYERNQFTLAKDALLSAVREDANNPEYLAKLASVYLAMGNADAAIECLKTVEAAGLSAPATYYILARAYRRKGDAARSATYLENFQRATSVEQDREARKAEAERPMAQAQRELDHGNPQAARVQFEKALQVDPSQWEPHAYIAEMDLNSGDVQGAYPHLQKLEQIDADSAIGNFLKARKAEAERPMAQAQRELDHGNPQAARVQFEKALQVDPSQWEPHAYIAEMDLNSGDVQGAYPHLQKLEQIDADSAIGNFLIARYW